MSTDPQLAAAVQQALVAKGVLPEPGPDPVQNGRHSPGQSAAGYAERSAKVGLCAQPLHDEPGFHWANPGVRTIRATAAGVEHVFVLKRLQPRSRREVLVYRALDHLKGAFMPRLWACEYDEDAEDYWLLLERGVPCQFAEPNDFQRQCGLVLARIHAAYWDRVADLPAVFHLERPVDRAWRAVGSLLECLTTLDPAGRAQLEAFCADELAACEARLASLTPDDLPATPPARCLIHGAFHSPEITWRDTALAEREPMPLAVDWETARVGAAAEDFDVAGSLWVNGDDAGATALFDAYLAEMARLGVPPDGDALVAAAREQAWVRKCEIMTWLVPHYLGIRRDTEYAQWCAWARGSIRRTLGWLTTPIDRSQARPSARPA